MTVVSIETRIDVAGSATGLRDLRKGLKDLVSAQAEVGAGSKEFKKLQNAINETEGKLGDLTDSFKTLKGSGVERLSSSLGLLREGFTSADPDKLKIALQGIGAAMKAIPIFLLIEGARLLYENFDKVVAFFKETRKESDLLAVSLNNQTTAFNNQSAAYDRLLSLSKLAGANETSLAKIEIERGEAAIKSLESQRNATIELMNTRDQSSEEGKKQFEDDYKRIVELEKAIYDQTTNTAASYLKLDSIQTELAKKAYLREKAAGEARASEFNRLLGLSQEAAEANAAAKISDQQSESDKIVEIVKKQIEDERDFKLAFSQQENEVDKFNAEETIRILREKDTKAKEIILKDGQSRIDVLNNQLQVELASVGKNEEAKAIIIKKYEQELLTLRIQNAQKYLEVSKQGVEALNQIGLIATQNENYNLNQQKYSKDAAIENDKNRTQEKLNDEINTTNQILANDGLTSEQREYIKFKSEQRKIAIQNGSDAMQLKAQQDFDKKELEIKKKQFERDKKLQLARAAVNIAAAILQAIAQFGPPPSPAGILGIAAAAAIGVLQVAAIASQKFDDGGAKASSGVAPVSNFEQPSIEGRSAIGSDQAVRPAFNPTGANGVTGGQTLKVVVLTSDINDAQREVVFVETRAKIKNK